MLNYLVKIKISYKQTYITNTDQVPLGLSPKQITKKNTIVPSVAKLGAHFLFFCLSRNRITSKTG